MSESVNEYFANEASEYLDQLERLLAVPGAPDPDHLFRLATGVRGSAQMAHAEAVARLAERLEDAARSIVLRDIAWNDDLRDLARRTIADLKLLVRAVNRWGPEEENRVREAIERWDEKGGGVAPALALGVVPIETLLQEGAEPAIVRAAEAQDGAESATFQTAEAQDGAEPAIARTAEAPAPAMAPEPAVSAATPEGPSDVVPIGALLFSGDAALREALNLRNQFETIARGDAVPERSTTELVQELFDLLELGLNSEPTEV